MNKKLTKQQFKAKLTNPELFAARKKVRHLRKELAKINWKVYSKYVWARQKQIELKLINKNSAFSWSENPSAAYFPRSSVIRIIEDIFPNKLSLAYNPVYLAAMTTCFSICVTIE